MPRLTPSDLILTSKVLAAAENEEPKKLIKRDLDLTLLKHQMTTDDCLETLSSIMHTSRKEINKITVAKLGLEMNGVLNEETRENSTPTIQFIFNDSSVNLTPMLNPKR